MCLPWPDPVCQTASSVTFGALVIFAGIFGTLFVPEDETPPNPIGVIVLIAGIAGIGWYFTRSAPMQAELVNNSGELVYPLVVLVGPIGIGLFFLGIGVMVAAATHVLVEDYV